MALRRYIVKEISQNIFFTNVRKYMKDFRIKDQMMIMEYAYFFSENAQCRYYLMVSPEKKIKAIGIVPTTRHQQPNIVYCFPKTYEPFIYSLIEDYNNNKAIPLSNELKIKYGL